MRKNKPRGIILKIVSAKNIQDKSRILEVPLASLPASPFCPVTTLNTLKSIPGYPDAPQDAVFNIPDMNGRWTPLTQGIASRILSERISAQGLDPKRYRFHAFRRGGMQAGSKVVNNLELLRLHGG